MAASIALGLDLSLREMVKRQDVTLDDYMRLLWKT